MASLLFPPGYQINDGNGKPVSGAKVYVYDQGTTDLSDVWQDVGLSSAHANPVIADSSGRLPNIYVAGSQRYDIEVKTSADVDVFSSDDVIPAVTSSSGTLPVASGGTGSTTASAARTALGAAAASDLSTLSSTVSAATTAQDTSTWETGTGTTETTVSPAKVAAAIAANEATQSGVPDVTLREQQDSGTDGGTFDSGAWRTRALNTEYDPGGICTLSSNEFTFTKDGFVRWSATGYRVDRHQTRLYNVTDGLEVAAGMVARSNSSDTTSSQSTGFAFVTADKTYRLEHQCQTSASTHGFGIAGSFTTEVYSVLTFHSAHQE